MEDTVTSWSDWFVIEPGTRVSLDESGSFVVSNSVATRTAGGQSQFTGYTCNFISYDEDFITYDSFLNNVIRGKWPAFPGSPSNKRIDPPKINPLLTEI